MGVYYRLVNTETNESIEPHRIGGGGIKYYAIIHGAAASMFAYLHMYVSNEWRIVGDDSIDGLEDATVKYVDKFNELCPTDKIEILGAIDD